MSRSSAASSSSVGVDRPHEPAAPVGAGEDQVRNPLRVTDRVGDGDRTALRHPEQREPLDTDRVHDELEVVDPGVEAEVVHVPVGQAAPTLVVADQPVPLGEAVEPVRPDRAVPLQFEVGQPVRRLDQWRSVAGFGVGDADAVRRRRSSGCPAAAPRSTGGAPTRVIARPARSPGQRTGSRAHGRWR